MYVQPHGQHLQPDYSGTSYSDDDEPDPLKRRRSKKKKKKQGDLADCLEPHPALEQDNDIRPAEEQGEDAHPALQQGNNNACSTAKQSAKPRPVASL